MASGCLHLRVSFPGTEDYSMKHQTEGLQPPSFHLVDRHAFHCHSEVKPDVARNDVIGMRLDKRFIFQRYQEASQSLGRSPFIPPSVKQDWRSIFIPVSLFC